MQKMQLQVDFEKVCSQGMSEVQVEVLEMKMKEKPVRLKLTSLVVEISKNQLYKVVSQLDEASKKYLITKLVKGFK